MLRQLPQFTSHIWPQNAPVTLLLPINLFVLKREIFPQPSSPLTLLFGVSLAVQLLNPPLEGCEYLESGCWEV